MSKTKIFFDTNILVYAHDTSSTYHQDSADLLKIVLEGKVRGVIAEQNIIELYRILTNSKAMKSNVLTSTQTKDLLENIYISGNFEIVYPNRATLDTVLQLAERKNVVSAKIFDIRIAALIIEKNIDYFATYNSNDF